MYSSPSPLLVSFKFKIPCIMVKVNSSGNGEELANALKEYILAHQTTALARSNTFKIAISGGSLVNVLAKVLLNNEKVQWPKWEIYFSDERLVALDDEDSNYGAFKRAVLDPLAHSGVVGPTVVTINESLVHQKDTATDAQIAHEYETEIPIDGLDLVLLGCGPDGHTCSLFPNHELLNSTKLVDFLNDSPKPPPRRITLTLPYLSKCKALAFVATGAGKQVILKEIFETGDSQLPCALVNGLNIPGGVCWFVDDAAIEGVTIAED